MTPSRTNFADRLAEAVTAKSSALVVGLDPDPTRMPAELVAGVAGREGIAAAIERFCGEVIDQVAPHVAAVKPQSAYFEVWGPAGVQAYEACIRRAQDAGLLVIGDVKRGDIGSTAAAYARAHLAGEVAADAVTLNPYLGTDSIAPFVDAAREQGAGLFVLVRTSNPSASELQDVQAGSGPLHEAVADLVVKWGADLMGECGYSSVGAVVGATSAEAVTRLRERMPSTWFLLPGVGAQGAGARDVAAAFDKDGLGAVVNSSRGVIYAYGDPGTADWRDAIGAAAGRLRDELRNAAMAPRA